MRSDRHSGLGSIFCGKMASSLSSMRSNEYFQYIVMTTLRGDFYIEKTVTYVFHTCTLRTLQACQINLLSCGDDNMKSHMAIYIYIYIYSFKLTHLLGHRYL